MPTYICEVCDKTEDLTPEDAYQQGWDYPPFIGTFGVVSPRTCGDCGIEHTAWWALVRGTLPRDLNEKHKATVRRILEETENEHGEPEPSEAER